MSRALTVLLFLTLVSAPTFAQRGGGTQYPVPGGGVGMTAGQGECITCALRSNGTNQCRIIFSTCDPATTPPANCPAFYAWSYCEDYLNNPGQPSNYCGMMNPCTVYFLYAKNSNQPYSEVVEQEFQVEMITGYIYSRADAAGREEFARWMAEAETPLAKEPTACRPADRLSMYREYFREITGVQLKEGEIPAVGVVDPGASHQQRAVTASLAPQ